MKKTYKILSFFIIIIILLLKSNIGFAEDQEKQREYTRKKQLWINVAPASSRDYIVDDGKRIPIPETYVLKDTIYSIKNIDEDLRLLNSPSDLFIDEQGFMFIVDTGNNRIIKANTKGEIITAFNEANGKSFNMPKGVYVDKEDTLYIADTGNNRIVNISSTGVFINEFVKPDSRLLDDNFTFDPTKLCVSPVGYLYILKGENILILDANNNFRGYMGQVDIGYSLLDVLLRIFASDEQKRIIRKRTAFPYTNITMDEQGMLYAVSRDYVTGEIKKINSVGNNIYKKYTTTQGGTNISSLNIFARVKLEDRSFVFGERINEDGEIIEPLFKDIAVDKNGIVTVIEENTGKVYQYDQEGNLLTIFGGKGERQGYFSQPESIAIDDDGCIYILDQSQNNIQVFQPTAFIKKIHEAVNLYEEGEYSEAYKKWSEILEIHKNYPLARTGLAKSLYKQKMWKESMDEYKKANDREGYSKAFIKYRYEILRSKFFYVFFISVIIIIIGIRLAKLGDSLSTRAFNNFYTNGDYRAKTKNQLILPLRIIRHPIELFELIKNNSENMSLIPCIIILILLVLVRIFNISVVHFPLVDINIRDSNIFLETIKLLLPVITWIVSSFAITAIVEGESKLKDIFIASSYCMVPYIIINPSLAIFSNVLSRNELTLYGFIINVTWMWIYVLFFIQLKKLNDYTFGKTISVGVVSILTMALIWAVGLMMYVLTGRLIQFILGLFAEIRMTFY